MKYYNTDTDLSFVLTDKADILIKEHNHVSKYIVGLVLSGSLNIIKNAEQIKCSKDDIFIIPIYTVHSINIVQENTRFLSMCVGTNFIQTYMNSTNSNVLSKYTNRLCRQKIITVENANAFLDAMEIVTTLYSDFENTQLTEIKQIGKTIVDKPEIKLCVDLLANKIYVSKYYFIRKFKEEIGLPPHSFYIQNRVRKAQKLLEEKVSVADVAVEVGFYDQSHFVKAFKSILGITPSEYVHSLEHLD